MDDWATKGTGGQIDRHATTPTSLWIEACYIAASPSVAAKKNFDFLPCRRASWPCVRSLVPMTRPDWAAG